MKSYKLIKEYPGGPKLGTEVIYSKEHRIYNHNGGNFYTELPKNQVENLPEFWEEIIEKDYEILSYIHNGSKHIWKKDSQLKDTFCLEDGKSPFTRLEDILKYPKIYLIHSVKRNDGEIFTIGDNVKSPTCSVPNSIISIQIINDKIRIYPRNSFYHLKDIVKLKQKLFTTEDGVDIFEGDISFGVNSSFKLSEVKHINKLYVYSGVKEFSTKEAAEEYMLMNKPCLSINDLKAWGDLAIPGLKKLAKEKINEK